MQAKKYVYELINYRWNAEKVLKEGPEFSIHSLFDSFESALKDGTLTLEQGLSNKIVVEITEINDFYWELYCPKFTEIIQKEHGIFSRFKIIKRYVGSSAGDYE